MSRLAIAFCCYLIAIVVFVCYAHSPQGALHYDDRANVTEYEPVQSGILDAALYPRDPTRNVSFATFALDVKIARWLDVKPSVVLLTTNAIIHGLAALAVFWLLALVTRRLPAAAISAAVWAAHPIHTTAVAYVTQRMASLATLGVVVTVCAWILWRRSGHRRWVVAGVLAFVFAALSKQTGLLAVPLLIATQWCLFSRPSRVRAWATWIGVALATLAAVTQTAPVLQRWEFTRWERLAMMPEVVARHAAQIVVPLPSSLGIWHQVNPELTWWTLAGAAIIVSWLYLARRADGAVRLAMVWVPIAMLLEFGPALIDPMAEYRMYMPTVGLALLLALSLRGRAPMALAMVACLLLTWGTVERVQDFRSSSSLWAHDSDRDPKAGRAATNSCGAMLTDGRIAEAELYCRRAVVAPTSKRTVHAWCNYGSWLGTVGRYQESLDAYWHALRLDPQSSLAIQGAALCLVALGHYPQALQLIDYGLQIAPGEPSLVYLMQDLLRARNAARRGGA